MKKRLLLASCLFTALALNTGAQIATTTSLVGTVTDASGKTVPGARVTAVNSGTHDAYTAVTSEQGMIGPSDSASPIGSTRGPCSVVGAASITTRTRRIAIRF